MKVTSVSICPTEAAKAAGRPALTPELLAASGARYSRNNEGLDAILSKIDPDNLDKSVDGIFKMVDYGHQSIADMVPIAMFIDELSIFLAYLIWSWCPTAGGQESSTRYIKLDRSGIVDPAMFGLQEEDREKWFKFINECFDAYAEALAFWEKIGTDNPELTNIPRSLIDDPSEKAQKQVARMKRNYAFDRSRYFLPVAAKTNMMLIMSARGWVQLCQNLLSHWLPEAKLLGQNVSAELKLNAPRMVKHAELKASYFSGHKAELEAWAATAQQYNPSMGEAPCEANIALFMPKSLSDKDIFQALSYHDNRYGFIGAAACRTAARFSWSAVALAEIRDLNRHRTGQKSCPLIPCGFYCAEDQVPGGHSLEEGIKRVGKRSTDDAHNALTNCNASFSAWILLGTQFSFEHTTTLDKFVYEAELRTGTGAHFRYASHLKSVVGLLEMHYSNLRGTVRVGTSEPE